MSLLNVEVKLLSSCCCTSHRRTRGYDRPWAWCNAETHSPRPALCAFTFDCICSLVRRTFGKLGASCGVRLRDWGRRTGADHLSDCRKEFQITLSPPSRLEVASHHYHVNPRFITPIIKSSSIELLKNWLMRFTGYWDARLCRAQREILFLLCSRNLHGLFASGRFPSHLKHTI